jgi:hypothetical protein
MSTSNFEAHVKYVALIAVMFVTGSVLYAQSAANASNPQAENSTSLDAPAPARNPGVQVERPNALQTSAPVSVTVLEDSPFRLQTVTAISTSKAREGDQLLFLVSENVLAEKQVAIPRGATVHGEVVLCKRSGKLAGSPELTLKLTSLDLGGQTYPLYSHQLRVRGTSKTRSTQTKILAGTAVGGLAGNVAYLRAGGNSNSGQAAAIGKGAVAGAGVGAAVAAVQPGPEIRIPAEAEIEFSFAAPVTVVPPSTAEIARLQQGLNSGGPSLYVRGETP